MSCDVAALKVGLSRIAAAMDACKDELNALDGELGDGDLGITMSRGMGTIIAELDKLPEDDVGMALFACAKCFTRVSGSSYGTLLATGLMAAAKLTKGEPAFAWERTSELVAAAGAAMAMRGKAQLGNKTVLDTLAAVATATAGNGAPAKLAASARQAAAAALEEFRARPAKVGRARMFAEKSATMDDPGMLAMARVIEALAPG